MKAVRKIIWKSDQEPAILRLRDAVKNESELEIIPEEVPVGESQGNGEVEGAIKLVKGTVRSMRLALQSKYGVLIKGDHPIVGWMVSEAAESINRYQVGSDGKTRRQRLRLGEGSTWRHNETQRSRARETVMEPEMETETMCIYLILRT